MTNAEKYLKENIDIEDILSDFGNMYADNELQKSVLILGLKRFFEAQAKEEQAKFTLTEDERVILRNLNREEFTHIGRHELGDLFLKYKAGTILNEYNFECYTSLFQFIKERRRILY